MDYHKDSIIGCLEAHALTNPHTTAFIIPGSNADERQTISYEELEIRVKALAVPVAGHGLSGERVLLIYDDPCPLLFPFCPAPMPASLAYRFRPAKAEVNRRGGRV